MLQSAGAGGSGAAVENGIARGGAALWEAIFMGKTAMETKDLGTEPADANTDSTTAKPALRNFWLVPAVLRLQVFSGQTCGSRVLCIHLSCLPALCFSTK